MPEPPFAAAGPLRLSHGFATDLWPSSTTRRCTPTATSMQAYRAPRNPPHWPAFMNVHEGQCSTSANSSTRIFYPTPTKPLATLPFRRDQPSARSSPTRPTSQSAPVRDYGRACRRTVYSIPGRCDEGLCVTPDGNIALSLRPGASAYAEIRVYDPARAHRGGSYLVEGHH